MHSEYAEEWFGWAQRFYDLTVEDEERRWMCSILCQLCWEIACTPYAEEFQARAHPFTKYGSGRQRCVLLSKRDESAPKKWVQVLTEDDGQHRWVAYAEFHPTIMSACEFLLVDPADMVPRFKNCTRTNLRQRKPARNNKAGPPRHGPRWGQFALSW